MIKANDVKIGNWILLKKNGQKGFYEIEAHDIEEIESGGEDCFPIPLTPDILDKSGFAKSSLGDTLCFTVPFCRPMMENKTPKHDLVLVDFGITDEKYTGKYAVAVREYDRDIQFGISVVEGLHQLQNLFYALAGTELTISL